ncbi:MAG: aldehyde dehydrogenase [Candidatus Kapaibacterium sp.]
MLPIGNYIDGVLCQARSGERLDCFEPATGRAYASIPASDRRDVDVAVDAATRAFPAWSAITPAERSRVLLRIADTIEARAEEFAQAESRDQGKPVWLCRVMDIPRAVANFRFFATEILHTSTRAHTDMGEGLNYTVRRPFGPVGCISPWNLPLYLFTWKVAPALAAGATVVAKPSEVTPFTAMMLAEVCIEAGLPRGVLNIVHGTGDAVGAAIVEHPGIKAVSFTGSTRVGQDIARTAGSMLKKVSLELGGKNATVVFADADVDRAVEQSVRAAFLNQGEICLCGSRVFVERSIYDRFRDAFVRETGRLVVGDPIDERTRCGALASEQHMQKVLSYIDLARSEGGTVACGGSRVRPEGRCHDGWFVEPTVIEGLPASCRTNTEEIFGPVVTLIPFDAEDEVCAMVNGTPYGLSASVWTENVHRAHRVAERLDTGIVWVNCWLVRDLRTPFGGVKQSGIGREGGEESLRFFTEAKNICLRIA